MHKFTIIVLLTTALAGCGDDIDAGKPQVPEAEKVTRPIEIDVDKESLKGRVPPPPNNADTATSPGQNVPTSKPATEPTPAP